MNSLICIFLLNCFGVLINLPDCPKLCQCFNDRSDNKISLKCNSTIGFDDHIFESLEKYRIKTLEINRFQDGSVFHGQILMKLRVENLIITNSGKFMSSKFLRELNDNKIGSDYNLITNPLKYITIINGNGLYGWNWSAINGLSAEIIHSNGFKVSSGITMKDNRI